MIGIYSIVNRITGKTYIGSARNVDQRLHQHYHQLLNGKHYNKELQRDFDSFGIFNFQSNLIVVCDYDDMEAYYNITNQFQQKLKIGDSI